MNAAERFDADDRGIPLSTDTVTQWAAPWQKPLLISFVLCWAVNVALTALRVDLAGIVRLIEGTLLLSAVATTLTALARRLPLQNVVTTASLIAAISWAMMSLGALSGLPFWARTYSDAFGGRILGALPWTLPLMWIVVLINARAVARLIMRPWRQTNFYNWW